jgi:hypothetical protein
MRWLTFTPAATANATNRQPVFDLSVGRLRDAPPAFLKGYKGHVHADGYAGYNPVYEGGATHVGCWVLARRYFFDARLSDPGRAHEALARIRARYAGEADAKARGITGAALAAHRREHAVPILAASADWLAEQGLGRALQDRVGTEAEGVRDPEPLAHFVPGWHAEATIAAQVQNHVGGRASGDQLEDGIGTQRVVVVLVPVAGQDAEDPRAEHVGERVLDEVGVTRVVEHGGELLRQADAFVELSERQQTGVGGERGAGDLDRDGQGPEKVEREQGGGW